MDAQSQPDTLPYVLVITRRGAREILISSETTPGSLPYFHASRFERFARQITQAVWKRYRLQSYCLWSSRHPAAPNPTSLIRYAVLEAVRDADEPPRGMSWLPIGEALTRPALGSSDQAMLHSVAQELDRYAATREASPFAQPGWIHDLFAWVEREVKPSRLTGEFEQLQASATFGLIRIETTAAAVWFKATGEPNAHERDVTLILKRLLPEFLPPMIAVHPAWNGWLSEEVRGRTLDLAADRAGWTTAAASLASMQIASREKTGALLESGCKELKTSSLVSRITPFLERMSQLMALQSSEPPQILDRAEMNHLEECLNSACQELGLCGWPDTVGHLDPNPRNILATEDGCVFLDWAEGYVGNPLFTFEYLSEHARRNFAGGDAAIETAYVREWRALIAPRLLARSLSLSPLVAVFAYAVADHRWALPDALTNPAIARYFRSLTRRAHREAQTLRVRSTPCPA